MFNVVPQTNATLGFIFFWIIGVDRFVVVFFVCFVSNSHDRLIFKHQKREFIFLFKIHFQHAQHVS